MGLHQRHRRVAPLGQARGQVRPGLRQHPRRHGRAAHPLLVPGGARQPAPRGAGPLREPLGPASQAAAHLSRRRRPAAGDRSGGPVGPAQAQPVSPTTPTATAAWSGQPTARRTATRSSTPWVFLPGRPRPSPSDHGRSNKQVPVTSTPGPRQPIYLSTNLSSLVRQPAGSRSRLLGRLPAPPPSPTRPPGRPKPRAKPPCVPASGAGAEGYFSMAYPDRLPV